MYNLHICTYVSPFQRQKKIVREEPWSGNVTPSFNIGNYSNASVPLSECGLGCLRNPDCMAFTRLATSL